MKDTQIHNGLPQQEVRDFLSSSLVDAWEIEKLNILIIDRDKYQGIDYSIENIKRQQENLNIELKKLNTFKSINTLVKLNNWIEFDISDFITKTKSMYRSFIGTEEEYKKFMNDNKFECDL